MGMNENIALDHDVVLRDGTKITTGGVVTAPKGKPFTLKNAQAVFVNADGKLVLP